MTVEVDLDKCDGYANCVVEAEKVFDLDLESGKAVVLVDPVPPELMADAQRAVESCPVQAIVIRG